MIRETSFEAYHQIKENGLLSRRRFQVYEILFNHGPLTGSEVASKFRDQFGRMGTSNMNIVTRLGEMRDSGVVTELGQRLCSVTGMKVILWDVTKNLPTKFDKPKHQKCPTCDGTGKITSHQARLF